MSEKRTMKLASRGKRFGAACIDSLLPFVLYMILMAVIIAASSRSMPGYGYGFEDDFGYGYGYGYEYSGPVMSGGAIAAIVVIALLLIAYAVVELVFFARGRSIGKMILGMQVVSSADGTAFGFWKMLLREVVVKQASNVFMLGFIWILIDEKNRGWHDKILDSYVVDLKESAKLAAGRSAEAASDEALASADVPAITPEPLAEPEPDAAELVVDAAAEVPSGEAAAVSVEEIPSGEAATVGAAEEGGEVKKPKAPVIRLD